MSEITSQTRAIDQSFSKAMSEANRSIPQKQPEFDLAEIQKLSLEIHEMFMPFSKKLLLFSREEIGKLLSKQSERRSA